MCVLFATTKNRILCVADVNFLTKLSKIQTLFSLKMHFARISYYTPNSYFLIVYLPKIQYI